MGARRYRKYMDGGYQAAISGMGRATPAAFQSTRGGGKLLSYYHKPCLCHGRLSTPSQPPRPPQLPLRQRPSPVIIRLLPLFGLAACLVIGSPHILHPGALRCGMARLVMEASRMPCVVWRAGCSGRLRGATGGAVTGARARAIVCCAGSRGSASGVALQV